MLSQRCTNRMRLCGALFALLVVAGCGGTGPTQEAAEAEQQVGAAGPARVVPPEAQTLYEQATAVMAAGDFVDAELRLKEFILLYPDYPGAYVNLAIIHATNENDAETEEALDVALTLEPDYPAALNQLGMLLRKNGKFLEAEAAYLKAVTVSPDYALAHYNLGVLNELYLQRLEPALRHFETYQGLVGEDKQVEKWIADLTRRIAASQRTANVAE